MSTQYQLTLRVRNGTSKHTTRVQRNKNSYMITHSSQSDFREAKYRAHISRNAKINANFRDVANTRWLQPGKLVIVYRPPNRNSDAPVSSKLLMQFTGPFRIEKIVRSTVHLKNLNGTPADTQNVRNVYPYNRENDHILQDFDHALLDDDDRDK